MVYPGTLFHRRQRGIPMHSYENRSEIRALRAPLMKHLPHGRRVHVGGALHGVRQGAGQDAAAGLLVHRGRHRLADQGGCRSRVLPWRRFAGHESHGVDIGPAPQHSQHGGAREDALPPDWRAGVHRRTVNSSSRSAPRGRARARWRPDRAGQIRRGSASRLIVILY